MSNAWADGTAKVQGWLKGFVNEAKELLLVRSNRKHVFETVSNSNATFGTILSKAKQQLLMRHSYLVHLSRIFLWLVSLYVVQVFVRIFWG